MPEITLCIKNIFQYNSHLSAWLPLLLVSKNTFETSYNRPLHPQPTTLYCSNCYVLKNLYSQQKYNMGWQNGDDELCAGEESTLSFFFAWVDTDTVPRKTSGEQKNARCHTLQQDMTNVNLLTRAMFWKPHEICITMIWWFPANCSVFDTVFCGLIFKIMQILDNEW